MAIEEKLNEKQGHWILARVGKRVLRPGGRELTNILIENLVITPDDDVIEFAPGQGFTASLVCAKKPKSYIGIDKNNAASELAKKNVNYPHMKMIVADASETTLPDGSATRVFGEAMLTMQSLEHKKNIVREAARILKPGGYYGIHEMGLKPDGISEEIKQSVYKELSSNIRVHARPLTTAEWTRLLEEEGFKVVKIAKSPLYLLEFKRVLEDEGFFRTLKIIFNIFIHNDLRVRIKDMRRTFQKHQHHIDAVAIVAQKVLNR